MAIVLITQGFDLFSLIYLVFKKSYYFYYLWCACVSIVWRSEVSSLESTPSITGYGHRTLVLECVRQRFDLLSLLSPHSFEGNLFHLKMHLKWFLEFNTRD